MSTNYQLFQRALSLMPGGVNSPVRAFKAVGGEPFFTAHADGAYLWYEEGNRYIDSVGSWGSMIVGHNHPAVRAEVEQAVTDGLSFGTPCPAEVRIAETISTLVPSVEMVRMVSSGTEATMSAIRLARAATGRTGILKFAGCYHGHADSFLVEAGSGALTLGVPSSPGVPRASSDLTLTLPYNDLPAAQQLFTECGEDIAAVIVEPIAGNMNCIAPLPGYLEGLRALCTQYQVVLIFDEVMTGFRVALGGAQSLYGVTPDLTTFGKIIGGGMPVGAYGGRRELMEQVTPNGPVYQAGTLSGHPVALAAGLAMLKLIQTPSFYDALAARAKQLCDGLQTVADDLDVPFHAHHVGGMFGLFFSRSMPINLGQVTATDSGIFARFFHAMLRRGIYLAPSSFEAGFLSSAHSQQDITDTLQATHEALQEATRSHKHSNTATQQHKRTGER